MDVKLSGHSVDKIFKKMSSATTIFSFLIISNLVLGQENCSGKTSQIIGNVHVYIVGTEVTLALHGKNDGKCLKKDDGP